MGQILVEIPTVDGTDAYRIAVDARASLDFALRTSPVASVPAELNVRIHHIEILGLETLHVPDGVNPRFDVTVRQSLPDKIAAQEIEFSYPLPKFEGFDLQLFDLARQPNGGAIVFGHLAIGGGGGPPVLQLPLASSTGSPSSAALDSPGGSLALSASRARR